MRSPSDVTHVTLRSLINVSLRSTEHQSFALSDAQASGRRILSLAGSTLSLLSPSRVLHHDRGDQNVPQSQRNSAQNKRLLHSSLCQQAKTCAQLSKPKVSLIQRTCCARGHGTPDRSLNSLPAMTQCSEIESVQCLLIRSVVALVYSFAGDRH